jgi:hypothetical protein
MEKKTGVEPTNASIDINRDAGDLGKYTGTLKMVASAAGLAIDWIPEDRLTFMVPDEQKRGYRCVGFIKAKELKQPDGSEALLSTMNFVCDCDGDLKIMPLFPADNGVALVMTKLPQEALTDALIIDFVREKTSQAIEQNIALFEGAKKMAESVRQMRAQQLRDFSPGAFDDGSDKVESGLRG